MRDLAELLALLGEGIERVGGRQHGGEGLRFGLLRARTDGGRKHAVRIPEARRGGVASHVYIMRCASAKCNLDGALSICKSGQSRHMLPRCSA